MAAELDITIGNRNELTKAFNFVKGPDGDVQFDTTAAHEVVTAVMEDLNGYWADSTHGSELYKLRKLSSRTPSQAEAMAVASLSTLERNNRINTPDATAALDKPNSAIGITLAWQTPSGVPQQEKVEV